MEANMACQQNKSLRPFYRLEDAEIDGVEAALNVFLPGNNPITKLIRMARECIRLREALLTVKVNLQQATPTERTDAICAYIDTNLSD